MLVCQDDKHHCKVGEPGYLVAAVEHRRQVIVALDKKMAVGDHDFTSCSIIPSVSLLCTIPDDISGSFCRGQVTVGFKDAVFMPTAFGSVWCNLDNQLMLHT